MRATGLESSFHYTYRREVYASGQEVFMTQRVARPMKFAAFISIIISVAVMLAACQGAVGKAGDGGATGPTGPTGPQGPAGDSGASALSDKVGDTIFITKAGIDAAPNADPPVEAAPVVITVMVGDYFVGGNPEGRIYTPGPAPTDPAIPSGVTYKLEGSILTLTVDGTWTAPNTDIADTAITVSAADTDGQRVVTTIHVRSNAGPSRETATVNVTVGTQDAAVENEEMEYGTAPVTCGMLNECVVDLSAAFDDNNMGDDFTLTLGEIAEADMGKVNAVIEGKELTVTGLKAAEEFSLMVKATDEAGADAEAEDGEVEMVAIQVTVDGAPTVGPIADQTMKVSDDARTVGTAIDPAATPEAFTIVITSDKPSVATAIEGTSDADNTIIVSSHNTGTATITVTVTEGGTDPVQKATDVFTVTVSG